MKNYVLLGLAFFITSCATVGAVVDGGEPTFEAIADGSYSISRSLYFYVKHAHVGVVPGINDYMMEWTKHWDADGALADAGMIPMGEDERAKFKKAMSDLPVLVMDDLSK